MHLVVVKEFIVIRRLFSGRRRADQHRDQLVPFSLQGSLGLEDREAVVFLDLLGPPIDHEVQQFPVKDSFDRPDNDMVQEAERFWGRQLEPGRENRGPHGIRRSRSGFRSLWVLRAGRGLDEQRLDPPAIDRQLHEISRQEHFDVDSAEVHVEGWCVNFWRIGSMRDSSSSAVASTSSEKRLGLSAAPSNQACTP